MEDCPFCGQGDFAGLDLLVLHLGRAHAGEGLVNGTLDFGLLDWLWKGYIIRCWCGGIYHFPDSWEEHLASCGGATAHLLEVVLRLEE